MRLSCDWPAYQFPKRRILHVARDAEVDKVSRTCCLTVESAVVMLVALGNQVRDGGGENVLEGCHRRTSGVEAVWTTAYIWRGSALVLGRCSHVDSYRGIQ